MTFEQLSCEIKNINEKPFRTKQIFNWLHKFQIEDFNSMTNLSADLRKKLDENFYIREIKTEKMLVSKIDGTCKFLFKFPKQNTQFDEDIFIESVVMKYEYGNTICISTQAGCNMGCKFCASTLLKKQRNLTASEMLLQIEKAEKELNISINNIVLMGIGEPLDNFQNMLDFLNILNDPNGRQMSHRHVTISTCGIVPKIKELADMQLQLTLTVSLHASNDETRDNLMPINQKYNLKSLIDSCNYYFQKTHRRVSFEFALINDVNDSQKEAEDLAKILKGLSCHVNLIPVNNVEETGYKKSSENNIKLFKNTLEKHGINTTIRRTLGSDINAACGQLRRENAN